MLNNFFKFFQNNNINNFNKGILNNLNLLNSVHYLDILKFKPYSALNIQLLTN
jgi:hypothetical protein